MTREKNAVRIPNEPESVGKRVRRSVRSTARPQPWPGDGNVECIWVGQ